jgi:hypothetical protein
MNTIKSDTDKYGQYRYYILPIVSEAGFADLTKFVSQEFDCKFGPLDLGPGTSVQKVVIERRTIVFVLSDATGAQFFIEGGNDIQLSDKIANIIDARVLEITENRE